MGTPEFAVPCLERLIDNNYNVVAVITSPDRLGGRGRRNLIESAVKKSAIKHNIDVLQPTNLKSPKFQEELRSKNANLQVVVAFRMLPETVWNMPEYGTYNLHGSLLPKFRGAAPINWAIITGERITGVTFFKLKHEIDTGDMLIRKEIEILPHDTAGDLHDRMIEHAAELVLKGVGLIESGDVEFVKQDAELVSKAPKIHKETCKIDFNQESYKVYNHIRGMSPYPAAWCTIDSKLHKLLKVRPYTDYVERIAGRLLTNNKDYLSISTTDGYIHVYEIQQEGKKRMAITDFLNGYDLKSVTVD